MPESPSIASATHEYVDHTAEVELRVRAGSLGELLAEAGRALGGLLLRGAPATVAGPWREIEVRAPDRAALLVDWLNELVFRAEAEWWVGSEFDVQAATDTCVRAHVRGVPVAEAPAIVKAATFHGLRVEEADGRLEATVIFDV